LVETTKNHPDLVDQISPSALLQSLPDAPHRAALCA